MKKVFMIVLALLLAAMGAAELYAQNAFFASKKGMVLTYKNLDDRGKTAGYSVLTIKDVKGSGKNMTITYGMRALDASRKPLANLPDEKPLTVQVKNDVVIFDMNQLIPAEFAQQGVKMDVSGVAMQLPANLQAGQAIKDSEVTMTVDLGITKLNTVIKMTGGKCLAVENVTVPAGTFKCHKITQTATTTVMGKNTVTQIVSWYAPGIGTVKTENFDNKGKLTSSSVLEEKKGD